MKKTLFFVLALAAICIIPSCKKDPAQTKVVFGNSKGMSVTTYENSPLVEQYGHDSWGYFIDLNNDGQNDVQFHSQIIGSPGMGRYTVTELICHENIALLGDIINQQRFLHIDTVGYSPDDSIIYIYINHTITCNQIAETDSIVSTNEKFSLYANNAGQSFDSGNSFMSTNVTLKNRPYYYPIGGETTIENIVYQHMHDEKDDCDTFPMDEEKYIGFKITKNDRSRLGWMKVILHHDYVELLETAIQK